MADVQRSRSALLVHDARDECDAMAGALEQHAFAVVRSQTGDDVFARLRELTPDVVVVGRPPMGIDAAQVCRAAARLAWPPVTIVAVPRPDVEAIALLMAAGASDFVLSRGCVDDLVARIDIGLWARTQRVRAVAHAPTWNRPMPEPPTPGEGIRLKRRGRPRARVVFLASTLDLGNGLRSLLSAAGFAVTVRRSPRAVVADVLRRVRDVVVIDCAALESAPADFCENLRKAGFKAQIVVTGGGSSFSTARRAMSTSASIVVELEKLVAWFNDAFAAENDARSTDSTTLDVRAVRTMLSAADFRVFEVLLGAAGAPVPREVLEAAAGSKRTPTKAALERRISRMRRKLVLFGLMLEPVRGAGYRCVRLSADAHPSTPAP